MNELMPKGQRHDQPGHRPGDNACTDDLRILLATQVREYALLLTGMTQQSHAMAQLVRELAALVKALRPAEIPQAIEDRVNTIKKIANDQDENLKGIQKPTT
jgi:hypothetical protein